LAKAVVLLTPLPPRGISHLTISSIKTTVSRDSWSASFNKPCRLPFSNVTYGIMNNVPAGEQKALYDKRVWESGRICNEIVGWFDRRRANNVDIKAVDVPLLVIGAGRDRIVPASAVKKIAQRYPEVSTYLEYPDNAHWIIGEPNWQSVAKDVLNWLHQKQLR
jgi:alpha-beta hydrolase superfamily lysophospholipase